jgi:hypothetical protein
MATEKKPLPFIYQFGAGAVAGVSEVSQGIAHPMAMKVIANTIQLLDPCYVRISQHPRS